MVHICRGEADALDGSWFAAWYLSDEEDTPLRWLAPSPWLHASTPTPIAAHVRDVAFFRARENVRLSLASRRLLPEEPGYCAGVSAHVHLAR
eukprot:3350667-Pleurochrysis_carterae.AAC.3